MIDYPARRQRAAAFVQQGLGKSKEWTALAYVYDYQEGDMLYLVWFDDNAKHTIEQKIAAACEAFHARYGSLPNVALVSADDNAPASVAGVRTQVERRVQRNNVHVGIEQ
jgi:hypothetical protein